MTSGGKLANIPSCWAARTSSERAEMAMPTQIDQPASKGVKSSWTSRRDPLNTADATSGGAKSATIPRKMPKTT